MAVVCRMIASSWPFQLIKTLNKTRTTMAITTTQNRWKEAAAGRINTLMTPVGRTAQRSPTRQAKRANICRPGVGALVNAIELGQPLFV